MSEEMNNRRSILAGTLVLLRRTMFGQKNNPSTATGPVPFGYKMGWIALKHTKSADVASFLKIKNLRSASWVEGIEAAYNSGDDVVFVTPPIKGWVLVVSKWAMGAGDRRSADAIGQLLGQLSTKFDEAQGFATHRIIEYHHWMLAINGHLQRSFAYIGESGEVLLNSGSLTDSEQKLKFFSKPPEEWNPTEEDVMTVASGWSIAPTSLTTNMGDSDWGLIGTIGKLL
jgi:hypothetical protein